MLILKNMDPKKTGPGKAGTKSRIAFKSVETNFKNLIQLIAIS